MIVLGIDPGPVACGVTLYDVTDQRVLDSAPDVPVLAVLTEWMERASVLVLDHAVVVGVERVQAAGISGASLLETSETVGMVRERCRALGLPCRPLYRREVLRALDVTGRGCRDAVVRERLLEVHGGAGAKGNRAHPGPLYGVASHAWQALAVAVAVALTADHAGAIVRIQQVAP